MALNAQRKQFEVASSLLSSIEQARIHLDILLIQNTLAILAQKVPISVCLQLSLVSFFVQLHLFLNYIYIPFIHSSRVVECLKLGSVDFECFERSDARLRLLLVQRPLRLFVLPFFVHLVLSLVEEERGLGLSVSQNIQKFLFVFVVVFAPHAPRFIVQVILSVLEKLAIAVSNQSFIVIEKWSLLARAANQL